MAVLNPDASASLAYFILATLGLRFAVYRFVQLRARDVNALARLRVAHEEVATETSDVGQTILETTPSQIYDVVVYRRRRRRSRGGAQPASRLAG